MMTDNEFEKYLNEADKELFETVTNYRIFVRELIERYNRQKAEIERLQKELEIKTQKRVNMYERLDAFERGKSKGRKEFAKRLKELPSIKLPENDWVTLLIDILLKEMEGEGK